MEIFGIPGNDFAAYWGALLSTAIALSALLHPRPTVTLRTVRSGMSQPIYRLRLTNNSKHPIVLGKVHVLGANAAIQTGSIDGWDVRDAIHHALSTRVEILIEPGKTLSLDMVCAPEPKRLALVLTWKSHRMLAWPLFPSILLRCAGALKTLQEHPIPDSLK
jgi:hypothetical protein